MKKILAEYFHTLNQLQISIFSFYIRPSDLSQNERHAREKIFRLMSRLRKKLSKTPEMLEVLEKTYEIFFSLHALKLRVLDPTTFEVCRDEMKKIMKSLTSVLLDLANRKSDEHIALSISGLTQSIGSFEELYRSVLQVVSPNPKVFLFFIQALFAVRDVLESYIIYRRHPAHAFSAGPSALEGESRKFLSKLFAWCRGRKDTGSRAKSMGGMTGGGIRIKIAEPVTRRRISLFLALLAAVAINHLYSFLPFLLPLTTLYVMQTSIGNFFYQGIRKFLIVFFIVSVVSFLIFSMKFFYGAMHDVIIGALIGMTANSLIFPRRADVAFREEMVLWMQHYQKYFMAIVDQLLGNARNLPDNSVLEQDFLHLPDWVYKKGFDSGLKKGYEFFLLRMEEIGEILLAMHHLARHSFDKEFIAKMRFPLLQCADDISQFFLFLLMTLELKNPTEKISDLSEKMQILEKQFYTIVPASLELLDMKQDYVYLAEFVYCLRDLCRLLLRLAATFQTAFAASVRSAKA